MEKKIGPSRTRVTRRGMERKAQILQVAASEWKATGHKLTVDASVAFWADLALLGLKQNVLSCVVSK